MTTAQKRPLGLKGRKQLQQQQQNEDREKKKARLTEGDSSFSTVALPSSSTNPNEQTNDGLTLEDLVQLKSQADELIDNPSDVDEDDDQLVNLLRGICHEAMRQIEIAEKQENGTQHEASTLPHQMLAWASLELGLFLTLHQKPDRFAQEDEPNSLEAWLSIASKVLDNLPSQSASEDSNSSIPTDLQLLPRAIALLKAGKPLETTQILTEFDCPTWTREQSVYLLRTIDRIILLKSEVVSQDPTPVFKILIKLLEAILSKNDLEGSDAKAFQRLLDQRLGDCHLAHGSLLAEKLEEKYYPEQDEEQSTEAEDEFAIDIQDPNYILSLDNLKQADTIFSKLLEDVDETSDSKDEIKTKLDETLLTIGNLLPPGPEREELYLRAGLGCDDENKNGNDQQLES
ncbi:hypothetical protein PCANC_18567 [Puccinia coronata f. sp. avenae]|uniref:Uncharacterized protein n=1 Tax=Puccinia coronata f. sp. avenae TaxID=200324 RepID=A0A2N5STB1_9BASI|nr:hypothetical protein PCANC_18567 [Puccinia coronata f. sp. avenae]